MREWGQEVDDVGRERTEGERLAAREFADAVRVEAERFFDAIAEELRSNPEVVLRARPSAALSEDEADRLALAAVHRDREGHPLEAEDSAPSEDEVRAWAQRREQERRYGTTPRAWNHTSPR